MEAAAIREAKEETCLDVRLKYLLGCYSDPSRDPRGHTVSVVYIASAQGTPQPADDARNIALVEAAQPNFDLAFDHGMILSDYVRFVTRGERPPLRC